MRIARTREHREFDADAAGAPRYAFCCTCAATVVLRKGYFRQAHYAHLPGQGTPECEEYHGGSGTGEHGGGTDYRLQLSHRQATRNESGGLYLRQGILNDFQLLFKFPPREIDSTWKGKVIVQGAIGQKEFGASDFARPKFVRIPFRDHCVDVTFRGPVDQSYIARLEGCIEDLSSEVTVFPYSLTASRRLRDSEELLLGEEYWLLFKNSQPIPKLLIDILAGVQNVEEGWRVARLALPLKLDDWAASQVNAVVAFTGRNLRTGRARAALWSPLPHHISEEGVYILPSETQEVAVFRSDQLTVQARGPDGRELEVTESGSDLVVVRGLSDGTNAIFFDGALAFELVLEECVRFTPQSIGFRVDGRFNEVFEVAGCVARGETSIGKETSFFVDSPLLLMLVTNNGASVTSAEDVTEILRSEVDDIRLDAGIFGHLFLPRIAAAPARTVSPLLRDRIRLLVSLAEPGTPVRIFSSTMNRTLLPEIFDALLSCTWQARFYPQVRLIEKQLLMEGWL